MFRIRMALVPALAVILAACAGTPSTSVPAASSSAATTPSSASSGPSGSGAPSASTGPSASTAPTASSPTSGSSASSAVDAVHITWTNGFTGPDRPVVEELVRRFNASQTEVQVELIIEPWDTLLQKLLPSYAAGEGPTLVALGEEALEQYANAGVWAPMDDIYASGALDKSVYVPPVQESILSTDGKAYGVPMVYSTQALYWNKDLFRKAGLDPEKPPTTWAEWADIGTKLTIDADGDGTPEQYGIAIPDHISPPIWGIWMWGNGGGIIADDGTVTLGDKASIDAVQFWADLIRQKHVSPVGISGPDSDALILSGKVGTYESGPWMVPGFKKAGFDFGVAPMPAGPAGQVTSASVVVFGLNAAADEAHKAAAVKFMNFWTSKESQLYFSEQVGFPPVRSDVTAADLASNPYVQVFSDSGAFARSFLQGIEQQGRVMDEAVTPAIQRITRGEGTAQELLPAAAEQVKAVLAK